MKIRQFKKMLGKYLDHSANKAEKYLVESWYRSFEKDNNEIIPGITNAAEEMETRQRILNRLSFQQHRKIWYSSPLMKVACSLLLVAAVGLFLISKRNHRPEGRNEVFTTLQGQTKKIRLSDSSVVWLNANSRLEIPASYSDSSRTVKLAGEAYFEVTHNAEKPFLVETKNITTKVLGTTFNVKAYQGSRFSKITLLTGRVWVKIKNTTGILLKPNQILQYDQFSHQSTTTNEQTSMDQKAWTLGKLVFNNTPMQELQEILFQSHGLQIEIAPGKLANARIYGEFKLNDQPEYIIKTICKLIHAKYSIKGKKVSLKD